MNQIGIFDICKNRHKQNSASVEANPSANRKSEMHERILFLLAQTKMTGKEISIQFNIPFNAISGRLSELKAMKKIRGTGVRKDGSEILEVC